MNATRCGRLRALTEAGCAWSKVLGRVVRSHPSAERSRRGVHPISPPFLVGSNPSCPPKEGRRKLGPVQRPLLTFADAAAAWRAAHPARLAASGSRLSNAFSPRAFSSSRSGRHERFAPHISTWPTGESGPRRSPSSRRCRAARMRERPGVSRSSRTSGDVEPSRDVHRLRDASRQRSPCAGRACSQRIYDFKECSGCCRAMRRIDHPLQPCRRTYRFCEERRG